MTANILVPIDFSDCTDKVLRRAAEVADELSAEVVLMHSVQLPPALASDVPIGPEQTAHLPALGFVTNEARQMLEGYAEKLRAQGISVTPVVTVGPPAEQTLELAEQHGSARIVIGTRGRRGLSKLLLGSVAKKVASAATCPTVVVESEWSPKCKAGSCAWCASGRTRAQQQLDAELDG